MKLRIAAVCTFTMAFGISIASQTGGTYDLSHAVVAGGGGVSSGGQFTLDGTSGQAAAGTVSGSGQFNLRAGFWAFQQLAPTAASVSISGRVVSAGGRPISRALLTIYGPAGPPRTAVSSPFGYFRFDDVEAGGTYVLEITSGRHVFKDPVRVLNVTDDISDIVFVAR